MASAHLDAVALDRQLNDFLATWDGSRELRELFINPAVPATQKVSILDKLNVKIGLQRELRNLIERRNLDVVPLSLNPLVRQIVELNTRALFHF